MFGSRALIPIVDTGAGGKRDMFRYTRVSIGFGGRRGWGGMNPQKSWAMHGQRNSVRRHKYVWARLRPILAQSAREG